MPFLVIPLICLIVGLVIMAVMMIMFGLIHLLLPIIVIVVIWQLVRGFSGRRTPPHPRPHTDWQDSLHERKEARHVKEETHHDHDDWSDF
ncbi:hypothetical protein [Lacticaseibacillus nasuensis]|uniref:Uncharacterized protein n=1 Tax=Lacticaseibacillus nasuensis JCM 17158 TaxID=1291734 RepID=A0A0R1JM61_9LACO|nr:hypothetical protein [Lacticaseibacillus nasuensis]KRK72576.1 hypothetical protein FD02_GL001549 [Lacticaseibacillus nasuensis JCM 17158]MCX2454687.1 hypothetical protein [Lacticaseibacillus nasuensis]